MIKRSLWPHVPVVMLICMAGIQYAPAQQGVRGAGANVHVPLAVGNQSPVVGVFGIPKAHGTTLPREGQAQWAATVDLTSHFQGTRIGDETIVLDGETTRIALQGRYGLAGDWTVGVEVPWVHHGGGFLDGFIIDWHDFWGFPQGGRDNTARNRINYRYERGGVTRIDIDSATDGLGDIVLSAQRSLFSTAEGAGNLYAQLKLPTGDADKLTGSGAADAGAGIEIAKPWGDNWRSNFRFGAAYLGRGDVLPDLQRRWVAYGGLGLVWHPLEALSFRAQFDAHTATYRDSRLNELSRWSGLLATGITWYFSRSMALDLSVIENVPNTDVVSDVTFQLRLRSNLDGDR